MKTGPVCVYIIECAGYVKIGVAVDPQKRLKSINTGAPVEARLVGSREFAHRLIAHEIESRLHRKFAKVRTNGEWFDTSVRGALLALREAKPHKLRDPEARHDSTKRWDFTGMDKTITNVLTAAADVRALSLKGE